MRARGDACEGSEPGDAPPPRRCGHQVAVSVRGPACYLPHGGCKVNGNCPSGVYLNHLLYNPALCSPIPGVPKAPVAGSLGPGSGIQAQHRAAWRGPTRRSPTPGPPGQLRGPVCCGEARLPGLAPQGLSQGGGRRACAAGALAPEESPGGERRQRRSARFCTGSRIMHFSNRRENRGIRATVQGK